MSPAAHWRLGVVLLVTLATFRGVTALPFTIVDDPSFVVHNPSSSTRSGKASGLLRTTSMAYPAYGDGAVARARPAPLRPAPAGTTP